MQEDINSLFLIFLIDWVIISFSYNRSEKLDALSNYQIIKRVSPLLMVHKFQGSYLVYFHVLEFKPCINFNIVFEAIETVHNLLKVPDI